MDFLSRFVSFEKPMGGTLTRLLYYFGTAYILWKAFWIVWNALAKIPTKYWDDAIWQIIKVPFWAIVSIMILRVMAEYVLAHFRIDTSLHDQVTGRAAPKQD